MNDWEEFNEILYEKKKKDFHGHLNMEDITDAGYMHAKRICKQMHYLIL